MTRKEAALTRSEQVFFDDPAVDRLMGVVMALATEHYVLRDRVAALERQLAAAGQLDPARLDAAPQAETAAADEADAATFTQFLLEPLLGMQKSAGFGGRFTLARKRRRS
jgi:hypothetical protein